MTIVQVKISSPEFVRVVYDNESPDWNYQSRTLQIGLGQAPAVYGYSPTPVTKPNDYRTDESPLAKPIMN